jgi:molecular chaperone IbpA
MTKTLSLRSGDIPRFSIGIESLLNDMLRIENQQHSYPPHNIIKKSETVSIVELAVAGFSKDEISVTTDQNVLTVKGAKHVPDEIDYVWKGISTRNFERQFRLGDYVEVVEAKVVDGILSIELEQKIPEEKLPKTIAIK